MMDSCALTNDSERGLLVDDEHSPLLIRHMSMEKNPPTGRTPRHRRDDRTAAAPHKTRQHHQRRHGVCRRVVLCLTGAMVVLGLMVFWWMHYDDHHGHRAPPRIRPQDRAVEHHLTVDVADDGTPIRLWYRTWGDPSAKAVLFVHGGPGNAVADYGTQNADFFDAATYWVVEVDQRGTGRSQPSVREDGANMRYYADTISLDQLADDYEAVRRALHVDRWLVFGGSFGSTVGIHYGSSYPEACSGLIVRGIYLETPAEMQAVYARSSHVHDARRLRQFDVLYGYAANATAAQQGQEQQHYLDPDDAHALTAAYATLVENGDRHAIWHWHAYENNLMEEDPADLLDPWRIDETAWPEARSVAFFETRLWLRGAYERPVHLLARVHRLAGLPHVSVCQGLRDEVCPARYTRLLTAALDESGAAYSVSYVRSGHEQSDPVMAACLRERLAVFAREYDDEESARRQQRPA